MGARAELPMTVDKKTELVSSAVLDRTFGYGHRLVNVAKSDLDVAVLREAAAPPGSRTPPPATRVAVARCAPRGFRICQSAAPREG
ncbi:MAG TPA: hypothetical protein VGM56_28605 [Byssovorax sp.]|jgi:hypothetical protein